MVPGGATANAAPLNPENLPFFFGQEIATKNAQSMFAGKFRDRNSSRNIINYVIKRNKNILYLKLSNLKV